MKKYTIWMALLLMIVSACSKKESTPSVPDTFNSVETEAPIYPDYTNVTVPQNIAPLHFTVDCEGDEFVTQFRVGDKTWNVGGQDVCISTEDWNALKKAALGQSATVSVYVKQNGEWTRFNPFSISVSEDKIDPYISYRLIAPSYVTYEGLTINQRCLETYEEKVVYSNMINTREKDGQCINCHAYQNGNPDRMQFHCRQHLGGTVIVYDGKVKKVQIGHKLKEMPGDTVKSGGVYPAWHPTLPVIAYSSNSTGQSFHTKDLQKIEVQDTYSDLILYDVEKEQAFTISNDSINMDCFPTWSPDGKWLYYCSANYIQKNTAITREMDLIQNYQDVHYNLYRRPFNPETRKMGAQELVLDVAKDSLSATLPRISPDGRYLMFTMAPYGVFHIWHNTADLYMLDLQSGELRCCEELNSPEVESFHNWSTNGHWVIFSSRRTDGNFTRPFMAHTDGKGHFSKPFELPQDNPHYHQELMRSYNVPEFMTGPVTVTPQEFAKAIKE